jgi:hypothetical protein
MTQVTVQKPDFWKRIYEFRANSGKLATLSFEKFYSECAIAKGQRNSWKFSKKGFWKTFLVSKSNDNSSQDLTIPCRYNSKLKFSPSPKETFQLEKKGWWKSTWTWKLNDTVFMEFKSNAYSRKNRGTITIHQDKHPLNEWLMLLGWYMS